MRVGIEIEVELRRDSSNRYEDKFDVAREALLAAGVPALSIGASVDQWSLEHDGSLNSEGVEVVSPAFEWDESNRDLTMNVIRKLRAAGFRASNRCGIHVHVEVRGLAPEHVVRVVRRYAAFQRQFDALVPAARRGALARYCQPVSSYDLRSLESSLRSGAIYSMDKYRTVSTRPVRRLGTIEFRQMAGSTLAGRVAGWVDLVTEFVAASANPAETVAVVNAPRASSKQGKVVAMLTAAGHEGVAWYDIQDAVGWDRDLAVAYASDFRRRGYTVEVTTYRMRLVPPPAGMGNFDDGLSASTVAWVEAARARHAVGAMAVGDDSVTADLEA